MVLLLCGDTLLDGMFPFLNRHDLDTASIACKQFRRLIVEKMAACLRKLSLASIRFIDAGSRVSASESSDSSDSGSKNVR